MSLKFSGGIRITEYRNTVDKPICLFDRPKIVTLLMKDGLKPVVECGDKVKRYTLVACNKDGFSAYAPVPGTVIESDNRYVVIENSMISAFEESDNDSLHSINDLTFDKLIEYTKRYGIYGSFSCIPLYKKLNACYGLSERFIINCLESEPSSGHVRTLIHEKAKELVLGAKVLMCGLKIKKCVFALGSKDKASFSHIQNNLNGESGIIFADIKEKYPAGNERLLLNAIYNSEIACDKEPWEKGYPVFSAETVINLYECLRDGLPVVYKTLSVSGYSVLEEKNFRVPIGTPAGDLFAETGLNDKITSVFIENGTINGYNADINTPVKPSTNSLIALKEKSYIIGSCIKCTRCTTFCPMNLVPFKFHENHEEGKYKENVDCGIYNCIECGICSFMCVGKVDLLGEIREEKRNKLTECEEACDTMIFGAVGNVAECEEEINDEVKIFDEVASEISDTERETEGGTNEE